MTFHDLKCKGFWMSALPQAEELIGADFGCLFSGFLSSIATQVLHICQVEHSLSNLCRPSINNALADLIACHE